MAKNMTDEQIEKLEEDSKMWANLILDKVLTMTPEERKALDKKMKGK